METRGERLPIERVWDDTYWGELGMVTFSSNAFPGLVLLSYIEWAREKGYKSVVIDVLDTLREYTSKLALLGIGPERYSSVKVVKVGGRYGVGRIVKRIPTIEEHTVERELTPLLSAEYSEKTATAVIGVSKAFALYSQKEALSLVDYILGFVGDTRRKAFYFVNLDILKNASPLVLPMLTAVSTTVVELKREPGKQGFRVVKALNFSLEGFEREAGLWESAEILKKKQGVHI